MGLNPTLTKVVRHKKWSSCVVTMSQESSDEWSVVENGEADRSH